MKIDPYKNKEKYFKWKEQALNLGIEGVTKANSEIIMQYALDMERGLNVATSNKKGARSFIRLNVIGIRLVYLAKEFEKLFSKSLIEIDESQLNAFFADMRNGVIKRRNGQNFKAVADYVKDFKAFWHWHIKVNRKKGIDIRDITLDLDTSREKPDWVYLTEEQVKSLASQAEYKYEVLIWFLFDTGIRAPTEVVNIKVSDFMNDFKELNIREETSKTFGRRIKLMLCSEMIREYIKANNFSQEDYIFNCDHGSMNRYLKRLAMRVLGDKESPAGQKYSQLTLYDFRHNSCCYWLPRYKSESALKYRFGWKKSDKIHYYSELLGMCDTITEEDMLIDTTMTEMQKKLIKTERQKEVFTERIEILEQQMKAISQLIKETRFIKNIPNTQQ